MATITDTFDRADAGTLGTASGGFSWTQVAGSIGISSNSAASSTSGNNTARAESALSADHYAQIEVVVQGANGVGPCCRFDASANTFYVAYDDASSLRLFRVITGGFTEIGSASSVAAGSIVKIQANGTTIKVFDDGVEVISVTDGDITGNTHTGILVGQSGVVDDFEAGDLSSLRRFFLTRF